MKRLKVLSPLNRSYSVPFSKTPIFEEEKYSIHYKPNKIVSAKKDTIGILCFDNLINVKLFLKWDISNRSFRLEEPEKYRLALDREICIDKICHIDTGKSIIGKVYEVETFEEIKPPKFITFGGCLTSY